MNDPLMPPAPLMPSQFSQMTGQNIICFAKDWSEDPTSCNHILQGLSANNSVLWLNSISNRAPQVTSGKDFKKILRKVAGFLKGPQKVGERLWVYTPLVLPLHTHPKAVKLNRFILSMTFSFSATG